MFSLGHSGVSRMGEKVATVGKKIVLTACVFVCVYMYMCL